MNDYSAHTYTKPDPNCERCGGRGVFVTSGDVDKDSFWTLTTRCTCTDIKPRTELEQPSRREIDS